MFNISNEFNILNYVMYYFLLYIHPFDVFGISEFMKQCN